MTEREKATNIFLVPAMWAALVAVPGIADRDLSHLRRISWAPHRRPPPCRGP